MPVLVEFLEKLSFLVGTPAVAGLALTASLIVVSGDWRLSLLALLVQYVLAGLLSTRLLPLQLAQIKIYVGLLTCPMLYWAARRVVWMRKRHHRPEDPPLPPWPALTMGLPFRVLGMVLIGLAVYALGPTYPLPQVPGEIGLACYWLGLAGLLGLILTDEPFQAGLALLTFLTGFELFYAGLESSLLATGLLAIGHLLLVLIVAYLTIARGVGPVISREASE
ncbi:MAG: hypothetical protein H5T62_04055 [Anaerolineae bacterium]|nr:hypothetical protein [Anaerolineae bacterium]